MLSLTPSWKMFAIILGAVSMCLVQPRLVRVPLGPHPLFLLSTIRLTDARTKTPGMR